MKFKIGDRVRISRKVKWYDMNFKGGETGTIITEEQDVTGFGVKFDKKLNEGHDCQGQCKWGFGYFVPEEYLQLIEETNYLFYH